jgi:hypothetical protein
LGSKRRKVEVQRDAVFGKAKGYFLVSMVTANGREEAGAVFQ